MAAAPLAAAAARGLAEALAISVAAPAASSSPPTSPTHAKHSGILAELRAAPGALAALAVLWRYGTLNVLVEHVELHDAEEGDIGSLISVYNLVALISALLLSCGMAPFSGMSAVVDAYGDTPLTRFTNISIMCVMGCSLINLVLIVLLSFYISAVDRRFRHQELRDFPMFGVPLLLFVASIVFAVLWVTSNIWLTLQPGYLYLTVTFFLLCAVVGIPTICYAFFFRLARLRHAHRRKEAVKDLGVQDLEALLAKLRP